MYLKLYVDCQHYGKQTIIATWYNENGQILAQTQQIYGDVQPSTFGTTTKSNLISIP